MFCCMCPLLLTQAAGGAFAAVSAATAYAFYPSGTTAAAIATTSPVAADDVIEMASHQAAMRAARVDADVRRNVMSHVAKQTT